MKLTKIWNYFIISILLFIAFIVFYGKKLDVSKTPQKADVIVCLGGGYIERLKKTVELYKAGYSEHIIITGTGIGVLNSEDEVGFWKTDYFKKNGIGKAHVVKLKETPNTHAETVALKTYMLRHHLKSALIVSDPPHLKRIDYMIEHLNYTGEGLFVQTVADDVTWWGKSNFCVTPKEIWEAGKEMVGLMYYFVRY